MRVIKTPHTLIIQNNRGCAGCFGGFFMLVGTPFIFGPWGLFINHATLSLQEKLLSMGMGIIAVITGIGIVYVYPVGRIVFDALSHSISYTVTQRRRTTTATYNWSDLEALKWELSQDSDNNDVYQLYMILNGTPVELSIDPYNKAHEPLEKIAVEICDFLVDYGYARPKYEPIQE